MMLEQLRVRLPGSGAVTLGQSAQTQAQQLTEGWLKVGLGGPDGVLAPSTKLAGRAPEPAEGSYRWPPYDGLVARADRRQAQAGGIQAQGQP
jgi:hypothetical protein